MSQPRVLALVGDENGCALWRVFLPFAELQRRGVFAHWKFKEDPETYSTRFVDKIPGAFDALLLPRLWWPHRPDAERFIHALHRAGLAIIYEVDDDVFSPAISDRQFALFGRDHGDSIESVEKERLGRIDALQLCDGVTVSSKRLQSIVRQYVDVPVEVVPNAIDQRWFKDTLRGCQRIVPPLTIGWHGGHRYDEDVVPIAEAWHNLARKNPDISFVVQGQMLEVLIDAVPPDRVRRLPWLPLVEYPRAMLNTDIGCASVAQKLFNTSKTPIKLWEYTMAGAAVVASPTLYGPVSRDGEDVLLAETSAEWEAALQRLIDDSSLRRRLRRNQRRRIAQQHDLAANAWRWPAAWQSILEQFHERRSIQAA